MPHLDVSRGRLGGEADRARNAEIATRLGVSVKTVQNHVSHVLQKLQVGDRTKAAFRARGM